jgi:pentapeptide repeat protein
VLLVAAGLFYTNDANRKQQQLGVDQQKLAVDQQKLALQGQVADRFTAAIDQLGQEDQTKQDKLSIRLGGIYALQRLMNDSPPDEAVLVQVLCAFVRTHAPRPDPLPKTMPTSPADVRAAVTVLGSRPSPNSHPLNFSDTLLGLDHEDLSGAYLSGADLRTANLSGANLSDANLSDANLSDANLSDANLSDADLIGANLRSSDLSGANLRSSDLSGANLRNANLSSVYLSYANLSDADLSYANLSDADLSGADLSGADLSRAGGLTAGQIAGARVAENAQLRAGVERPTPSLTR